MHSVFYVLLSTLTTFSLATTGESLKCHVCFPDPDDASTCTATDFGEVEDGCTFCYAEEINDKQVRRFCVKKDDGDVMACAINEGLQYCKCNNADLCNKVFAPVIKCHECYNADGGCTTQSLGPLTGGCLACNSIIQANGKDWSRGCLKGTHTPGCKFIDNLYMYCVCGTDECNTMDITQPTMRCYVCKPKAANDTSCNSINSARVQDGCLTCGTEMSDASIKTRSCKDYAKIPSRIVNKGNTVIECNTDLCNGEGVDKVNDVTTSKPTSKPKGDLRSDARSNLGEDFRGRGVQKTVSCRVLIGGVLAAMLGLACYF